ncbi:uncharacterized protein MICPUCDRAFT_47346 [Micromonas pusilla CCMP1545]|jgi:pre-60S factor REI1|uniref:Predicted protein n=1 Tax=Micromonas pusilla (strain CCMP1545) TaxID=564608 RepID=C1MRQ9_MICPC|nr:uncharacterized protein MICPUCDRAFT_47346 [Micromonas pusilla CCMP1545]EEH57006.1 predicted protein [Micromonas pusilla CCMP1545]|tara:strand:+ start:1835 stop:2797 length:963 start_codon:yes stop_codon:yes gene_type:complete|eukprot:XP_003058551.1 predicted protein [Micromonas pusilla CCMP1545]
MQYEDEYEDDGLTCNTAPGVTFLDMDELKEHYRSDWHRYNLKRKVAGLPVVGKELFERVMAQAAGAKEAGKQTGTSHLKRPEELPRSVQRAKRMEEWVEHHKDEVAAAQAEIAELQRRIDAGEILTDEEDEDEDDEGDSGDESGWESMDDDDAQAVLARMETMAREGGEDDSDDESDSDDAENMELDLTNAPVQLADNGYELIVTRDDGTKKRIGPRELRRYYKQRPRPEDQRPMVLANKAENHERGLARIAENGGRGITKFDSHGRFNAPMQISILVRRAQKASRRYEGMNMIKSGSGNKKFDMNGQNAKTKLPKACPY